VLFVLSYCSTTATDKNPLAIRIDNNNNNYMVGMGSNVYVNVLVAREESKQRVFALVLCGSLPRQHNRFVGEDLEYMITKLTNLCCVEG
jgi:hypothetical protein